MDVLVVGANGLLGSNLVSEARDRGLTVGGTYHSTAPGFDVRLRRLDIRDDEAMRSLLEEWDPDAVVNCAAMTDVDACESNPAGARAVNGEAPGIIAKHCDEYDVRFVHVSTDYVFDGKSNELYRESDDPNPVQVYGESKLTGERAVREATSGSLIVRLSFVFGTHGSTGELTGFPAWVRDRFRSRTQTSLFTDQRVTPTRAGQAASTILELLEANVTGTVHVAARSCVTPYEFGESIRRRMSASQDLLVGGSMASVERDAERPSNSCLSVERVADVLGRTQPTLEEDLAAIDAVFD